MNLGDFRKITAGYPDDCDLKMETGDLYSDVSGVQIRETAIVDCPAIILHK